MYFFSEYIRYLSGIDNNVQFVYRYTSNLTIYGFQNLVLYTMQVKEERNKNDIPNVLNYMKWPKTELKMDNNLLK
ncbi:hypothetical protein SAMN04515674_102455 [Pseudarcicella hirudinis]|uniref:Uncharacterized protein n=1 Tax=Pseudarcicella hirudinis TaxID=1079859 RepID=A0A1I5PFI9_9BACT|nr:hypothetical protein SAMN04515674_102455 [Pseudarcicella hirudinis]